MRIRQFSSSLLSRLSNSVPQPEIMKITILIGFSRFSLVLILLLNNICIGSEQDTEEKDKNIAFKNEIINPDTIRTVAHVGLIVVFWTLIGTVVMYPILLLIPLIVAWIVLSGTVALVLLTMAHGGPNDNYLFYEGNPLFLEFVAIFIPSLFVSPFLIAWASAVNLIDLIRE